MLEKVRKRLPSPLDSINKLTLFDEKRYIKRLKEPSEYIEYIPEI